VTGYLIVSQGSPSHGPAGCVTQPMAAFVSFIYVKLKDRKRLLRGKNDHNAL